MHLRLLVCTCVLENEQIVHLEVSLLDLTLKVKCVCSMREFPFLKRPLHPTSPSPQEVAALQHSPPPLIPPHPTPPHPDQTQPFQWTVALLYSA